LTSSGITSPRTKPAPEDPFPGSEAAPLPEPFQEAARPYEYLQRLARGIPARTSSSPRGEKSCAWPEHAGSRLPRIAGSAGSATYRGELGKGSSLRRWGGPSTRRCPGSRSTARLLVPRDNRVGAAAGAADRLLDALRGTEWTAGGRAGSAVRAGGGVLAHFKRRYAESDEMYTRMLGHLATPARRGRLPACPTQTT